MIRKTITPDKQTVSVELPESYIGKQIELLIYATDELQEHKTVGKKNIVNLRGGLKLTEAEYQDFQQFVNDIRHEGDKPV
jgi:hypothetical protein